MKHTDGKRLVESLDRAMLNHFTATGRSTKRLYLGTAEWAALPAALRENPATAHRLTAHAGRQRYRGAEVYTVDAENHIGTG